MDLLSSIFLAAHPEALALLGERDFLRWVETAPRIAYL